MFFSTLSAQLLKPQYAKLLLLSAFAAVGGVDVKVAKEMSIFVAPFAVAPVIVDVAVQSLEWAGCVQFSSSYSVKLPTNARSA